MIKKQQQLEQEIEYQEAMIQELQETNEEERAGLINNASILIKEAKQGRKKVFIGGLVIGAVIGFLLQAVIIGVML